MTFHTAWLYKQFFCWIEKLCFWKDLQKLYSYCTECNWLLIWWSISQLQNILVILLWITYILFCKKPKKLIQKFCLLYICCLKRLHIPPSSQAIDSFRLRKTSYVFSRGQEAVILQWLISSHSLLSTSDPLQFKKVKDISEASWQFSLFWFRKGRWRTILLTL